MTIRFKYPFNKILSRGFIECMLTNDGKIFILLSFLIESYALTKMLPQPIIQTFTFN